MKNISKAPGDLEKMLNGMLKNTLISFHSDLSSKRVSPYDTGRFAASWFVNGQSNADSLTVNYKNKYTISNPLPYAERLCFGGWAVSQPKDWFPAYFNGKGQRIVNKAVRDAEAEL